MSVEFDPIPRLVEELQLPVQGVAATVALLAEGNTVPFIARYRKEATGGLDEVQILAIEERRAYALELEERRQTILSSIEEQGKLTEELGKKIRACMSKAELEDLYLPYKPKRRTRATIARERGLEPLAERILAQPEDGDPFVEAKAFVNADKGVEDDAAALSGARDIVAEVIAEVAEVRAHVRQVFAENGELVVERVESATQSPTKFEQYYEFAERVQDIPSHRYLAIRRGENEGVLRARIAADPEPICGWIASKMAIRASSPFASQLNEAVLDSFRRLLAPTVETDVRGELKLRSDKAAVDVFADNLRNLLLAAPLGTKSVIGIDPGLRTGCKCAAVDATGKFLDTTTLYISRGERAAQQAADDFVVFVRKYDPAAIAVGNGTGGREAEAWVRDLLRAHGLDIVVVPVNESGASIYSASDVAREEFPDLDLTIRGAISIARRLQDPLAELVKIDPKSIGVGQYQHDVYQALLQRKLGEVIESCVNHVGVVLNTASASLLTYVAGITKSVAKKIVVHREENGAFATRKQLLDVSGLGPRAFEQAAGFLRIPGGDNPLDGSAVHPERYELVERMCSDLKAGISEVVGDAGLASQIEIDRYVDDAVGLPTLRDIVLELKKPGRDPRATFEPPRFRDDVHSMEDLKAGMALEGVVTNVTAFGAFVDIGVHQDGLVHVSQLADRFVKDPAEVAKVGDKIQVRVLDVDLERKRISLSARSESPSNQASKPSNKANAGNRAGEGDDRLRQSQKGGHQPTKFANNPFANLRGK